MRRRTALEDAAGLPARRAVLDFGEPEILAIPDIVRRFDDIEEFGERQ
jgi:hypothetical protein